VTPRRIYQALEYGRIGEKLAYGVEKATRGKVSAERLLEASTEE
jgi:hypothetical protein